MKLQPPARTKGAAGPAGRAAWAGPEPPRPARSERPRPAAAPPAPTSKLRTRVGPRVVVVNSPRPQVVSPRAPSLPPRLASWTRASRAPRRERATRPGPSPRPPPASCLLPPGRVEGKRGSPVCAGPRTASGARRFWAGPFQPLPTSQPAIPERSEPAGARPSRCGRPGGVPASGARAGGGAGAQGPRGGGLFARCCPRRIPCPRRLLGAIPVSLIETRLRGDVEQGRRREAGGRGGRGEAGGARKGPREGRRPGGDGAPGREGSPAG